MFEEEINIETERIIEKINHLSYKNFQIVIENLYEEDFYRNFLKAETEFFNYKILLNLSLENEFSYDLYQNFVATSDMQKFVLEHSDLTNDYLNELIKRAVEIRFNYMIRPITTISSFVFSNNYTISFDEFKHKINYFPINSYFVNLVYELFDEIEFFKEENEIITKSQFSKLIFEKLKNNADNIEAKFLEEISNPLFKFLNDFNLNNHSFLSFLIFFDDLKMYPIIEFLNENKNYRENFNFEKLTEILSIYQKQFITINDEYIEENTIEELRDEIELEDIDVNNNIDENPIENNIDDENLNIAKEDKNIEDESFNNNDENIINNNQDLK